MSGVPKKPLDFRHDWAHVVGMDNKARTLQNRIERLSGHAAQRALGRLADAGIPAEPVCMAAAQVAAHYENEDVAVRLLTLPTVVGDTSDDLLSRESNGNELWSICRGGTVINLMFRRSTQPKSREAFADATHRPVDRVAVLDGGRCRTIVK